MALVVGRPEASPRERVTIRTAETPQDFALSRRLRPYRRPIRLYVVSDALAAGVRSVESPRLNYVGTLVPDARGRGLLRLAVPPLDPGRYVVASWCPTCPTAGSRGRARIHRDTSLQILPAELCPAESAGARPPPIPAYGNGLLSTSVPQPGTIVAEAEPDGSLFQKLGWIPNRILGGLNLTVRGERVDEVAPPMRVLRVSWGTSSDGRGSWASAVLFPSEGCWRISGRVADVSLTYTVRVVRG